MWRLKSILMEVTDRRRRWSAQGYLDINLPMSESALINGSSSHLPKFWLERVLYSL